MIGAKTSGYDLSNLLSETASRVTLSRHNNPNETVDALKHRLHPYLKNVTFKDDVMRFTSNGAEFIDGTHQTFDAVILATGNSIRECEFPISHCPLTVIDIFLLFFLCTLHTPFNSTRLQLFDSIFER